MLSPLHAPTVIGRATAADASGIAAVHVKSWRETYLGIVADAYLATLSVDARTAMWGKIIANAPTETALPWVAVTDNGEVVGFASGGAARSSDFAGYGELYAIYLLNAWKGRGIGRELFSKAKADVAAAGFDRMMLWVLKDNPTLGFYLKHGGSVVSEKVEIIGCASLPECALVWQL